MARPERGTNLLDRVAEGYVIVVIIISARVVIYILPVGVYIA